MMRQGTPLARIAVLCGLLTLGSPLWADGSVGDCGPAGCGGPACGAEGCGQTVCNSVNKTITINKRVHTDSCYEHCEPFPNLLRLINGGPCCYCHKIVRKDMILKIRKCKVCCPRCEKDYETGCATCTAPCSHCAASAPCASCSAGAVMAGPAATVLPAAPAGTPIPAALPLGPTATQNVSLPTAAEALPLPR